MTAFNFQRNITAAVAALTALVVALSAAREWAYYQVIGADFIYLSFPADYTGAILRWLPGLVLTAALIAFIEMLLLRTEGFRSEEEIVQRFPNPQRTMFFRALPWYFVLTLLTGGGFLRATLVDNPTAKDWLVPALGCWILFLMWFVRHSYVRDRLTRTMFRLLMFGPMVVGIVISGGYDEAVRDLALTSGEYRVVHSTGLVEDDVQLLRRTSQGILILRVPTRDISFLTYQSFKSVDFKRQ